MGRIRLALTGIVLAMVVARVTAGETVSHPELGFRITVPDGFVEDKERVQGKVVYTFQRAPAGDQKTGTLIVVSRLGGVLKREKVNREEISAKNPQVTFVTEKWKEFDIDVSRVPEQVDDLHV